jgi:ribosomal protein S1
MSQAAWDQFIARYGVGDVVDGQVIHVVPFGAFVRVGEVDGLAPQALWPDRPEVGSTVRARIAAVDTDRHRFSLAPA